MRADQPPRKVPGRPFFILDLLVKLTPAFTDRKWNLRYGRIWVFQKIDLGNVNHAHLLYGEP